MTSPDHPWMERKEIEILGRVHVVWIYTVKNILFGFLWAKYESLSHFRRAHFEKILNILFLALLLHLFAYASPWTTLRVLGSRWSLYTAPYWVRGLAGNLSDLGQKWQIYFSTMVHKREKQTWTWRVPASVSLLMYDCWGVHLNGVRFFSLSNVELWIFKHC